ncbi:Hsp70 family protein [Plantactinospora sp. DSM 117369]
MDAPHLAIDFGTSNTVAVVRLAGRCTPLLFDGSPLLPSAVYLPPDADLLVGRDAERSAGVAPERLEPNPKRRIDDRTVWLGDRELSVVDVIAAVLRRVVDEASRVVGRPVAEAVLTHPAGWGGPRRVVLTDAARQAGLDQVRLVAEPVAAASYFVTELGKRVPVGRCVVVYDLGAGTFDVAAVRRTDAGFEVLAAQGLPDVGGLDLDAAIVGHVRSLTAGDTDTWARLDWPDSPADRRARLLLWQDVRSAKEQLSRHTRAELHVPLTDTAVHLTRDEFETLAGPLLNRTVEVTTATLRAAGVGRESIAGIFLVGGASRIPLAANLLHRTLRIAPTVLDQPELVVATGAHTTTPTDPADGEAPAGTDEAWPATTESAEPAAERGASAHRVEPAEPTPATPTPAPPAAGRPERSRAIYAVGWLTLLAGWFYHGGWFEQLDGRIPPLSTPVIGLLLCMAAGVLMLSRRWQWAGVGLIVGYAAIDALTMLNSQFWLDDGRLGEGLWGGSAYRWLYREMPLSTIIGKVAFSGVGAAAAGLIVRNARTTPPRRPAWTPLTASLVTASMATAVAFAFVAYDGWPQAVFFPSYFFPGPAIALGAGIITAIALVVRPATLGIGLIGSWTTLASAFLIYFVDTASTGGRYRPLEHPVNLVIFAIVTVALVILLITYTVRTQRPSRWRADRSTPRTHQ